VWSRKKIVPATSVAMYRAPLSWQGIGLGSTAQWSFGFFVAAVRIASEIGWTRSSTTIPSSAGHGA